VRSRRAEVAQTLNGIVDPCSAAAGVPIGLVDMGIIDGISVTDRDVVIRMLPTFPACLFVGVFQAEITKRISSISWCADVVVELAPSDPPWEEDRMSADARARLAHARAVRRARPR
jgi:metal-sulfur cluster biosynthetic enzyme